MTIIQLEYLLAVANCGSFSQAAEHCFVTQPSLSMQIKNLEEELGVVLLDRSRKPVIATDAGEVVIRQAREAIKSFKMVRESVADLRGEVSGVLRLGVIPTIAPYLLHRFVPGFARDYPNVELQIRELMTADIIRALGRDMLDAAILAGGTSPDGIQEEELFNDRFYAYVSTGHPLFERSNIRIEDIDVRRLLLLSEGNCLRDQVLELCQAQKGVQRQYSFESGSLETLIRIVDNSSNMMTIVPEMVADFIDESHKPQLKTLGARFGKQIGEVRTKLAEVDGQKAMNEIRETGAMTLTLSTGDVQIAKDDLLIDEHQKEGYAVVTDRGYTVVLDTTLTPELIEEGNVREIVSKIQTMRKDAGFEVMDHIVIYCDGSDKVAEILTRNKDSISEDTLADEIVTGKTDGFTKEQDINGESVTLGVKKI